MKKNWPLSIPGFLLIGILIFAGILSWQGYRNLENRAEELEQSLVALESELKQLNEEVAELEKRLEMARREAEEEDELLLVEGLVRIRDLDPTIEVDLRYAGEDNFTGRQLYPVALCLLQKGTAEKLISAQAEFRADGYSLKIWDAYRPLSVQENLWEAFPDSRYVASPEVGSNHNRGAAVDVTLVDEEGEELVMPTGFDEFVPEAARSYPDIPDEARENMEYLTEVMVGNGFTTIESEWWHFNDENIDEYPLLDVRLEDFAGKYFSR